MQEKDLLSVRSNANENQVGGKHYYASFQHWDLVAANNMDYFVATITKYATRWRKKNGVEDVRKALHYHQKLTELLDNKIIQYPKMRSANDIYKFLEAQEPKLSGQEINLLYIACTYQCEVDVALMGVLLNDILEMARGKETQELIRS